MLKQIAALKTTTAAMLAEVTALQTKAAELEAREPAINSLPAGPAGGDFSGTYPSPKLKPNVISSSNVLDGSLLGSDFAAGSIDGSEILDSTIGFTDFAPAAIGHAELVNSHVGGPLLAEAHFVKGSQALVDAGKFGNSAAACPPGEVLLSGGMEWALSGVRPPPPVPNRMLVMSSHPRPFNQGQPNPQVWEGLGRNGSGSLQELFAVALCLKAGQ